MNKIIILGGHSYGASTSDNIISKEYYTSAGSITVLGEVLIDMYQFEGLESTTEYEAYVRMDVVCIGADGTRLYQDAERRPLILPVGQYMPGADDLIEADAEVVLDWGFAQCCAVINRSLENA